MTSLRLPNTISPKATPKCHRLHAQSSIPLSITEHPPSVYPTHSAPMSIAAIFSKVPTKRTISFSQLSNPPVHNFSNSYKGSAWKLQEIDPLSRTNTEDSAATNTSTPKGNVPNISKMSLSHRASNLPQTTSPSYFATRFHSKLTTPDIRTPCLTEAPTPKNGFSPRDSAFRATFSKLLKSQEGFTGMYNSTAPTRRNSNPKLEEMLAIIERVPTLAGASNENYSDGSETIKLNNIRLVKRRVHKKSLLDDVQSKANENIMGSNSNRMLQTASLFNRVNSDKQIGMNMALGPRGARRVIFTEAKDAYEDYGMRRESNGENKKSILRVGSAENIHFLAEFGLQQYNYQDDRFKYTENDIKYDKFNIPSYLNLKEPEISNLKLADNINNAHPLGYLKIQTKKGEKSSNKNNKEHPKELDIPQCNISTKSKKQKTQLSVSNVPLSRGEQLIAILRSKLDRLRRLKLTIREVMMENVFSSVPYERKGAREFIEAAKHGNLKKLEKMMDYSSRYLVYDFDHVYQTALHFAAKRGFYNVGAFLINLGANVDARDMTGRTPLYFAIKYKHYDLIELLVANGADPWPTDDYNYKELCKSDKNSLKLITKAKQVWVVIKMANEVVRLSMWRKAHFVDITRIIFSRDEPLNAPNADE